MSDEWIAPYYEHVNNSCIYLPGNNSCSLNLIEALKFAIPKEQSKDKTATLFVIACQNFEIWSHRYPSPQMYGACSGRGIQRRTCSLVKMPSPTPRQGHWVSEPAESPAWSPAVDNKDVSTSDGPHNISAGSCCPSKTNTS